MAVAAAKKNTTTAKATVRNPARKMLVGGRGKKTTRRRTNTPAKTVKARRRRSYRRNPSPTTNAVLFAIGGALVINAFDYVVTRFVPQISNTIRILGKAGAGWAIGKWGKKYIGNYADIAQNALWLAAALDVWDAYVAPFVNQWLGGSPTATAPVVSTQQIQDTSTGQLGMRYNLADGNQIDYFPEGSMGYAS